MTVADTADERFSGTLRRSTRVEHRRAEKTGFVHDLLAGRLDREAYATLLGQLRHVYQLLEEAGAVMAANPLAGPFLLDGLARLSALEEDLAFLYGSAWRERTPALASTSWYCERLAAVAFSDPACFVAHHYTRYMGDLSGGQIIGAVAARTYGLDGPGWRFYRFPATIDVPETKVRYRELLDTTPWDADQRARLIDEARLAFQLNTDLFVELGAMHAGR